MSDDTAIRVARHGPEGFVAELILDRPGAMNAISTATAAQLRDVASDLARPEAGVRAVVVTSTHPKAFCVGADLKERNTFTDADLMAQRPIAHAAYTAVLDLPMPAIAAVEGYALGGGFEIALSCDLIVAGQGATFALPEVSVGVIPGGGGTQLLTRRVGWSVAAKVIFTAARLSAQQGLDLGFVDELTPAGSARDRGLELAGIIAGQSPIGVRNAKRAMRLGFDVDLQSGLEIEDACWRATVVSPDRREGIAAFVEKRQPRWQA